MPQVVRCLGGWQESYPNLKFSPIQSIFLGFREPNLSKESPVEDPSSYIVKVQKECLHEGSFY
jgi:hypothetical protein